MTGAPAICDACGDLIRSRSQQVERRVEHRAARDQARLFTRRLSILCRECAAAEWAVHDRGPSIRSMPDRFQGTGSLLDAAACSASPTLRAYAAELAAHLGALPPEKAAEVRRRADTCSAGLVGLDRELTRVEREADGPPATDLVDEAGPVVVIPASQDFVRALPWPPPGHAFVSVSGGRVIRRTSAVRRCHRCRVRLSMAETVEVRAEYRAVGSLARLRTWLDYLACQRCAAAEAAQHDPPADSLRAGAQALG
ncbi:MAG: hypothetical protein ACYCU7_18335 [Acidimicrobiales bacterium]